MMTDEERLALGRVCGCGECEYCEDVVMDSMAKALQKLVDSKKLTAERAVTHHQAIKEYRQWPKSK